MAAVTSSTTTSPTIFRELSSSVTAFIAEIDAKENNGPNSDVCTAIQLLIAIENAANIFKAFSANGLGYMLPPLAKKVEQLEQMIVCLKKDDYCRLNLPIRIMHSMGNPSHEKFPKLYAVNPQYVVPKAETMVQFFGQFKDSASAAMFWKRYLPKLQVGEQTFIATKYEENAVTFKITFDSGKAPFKKDKNSQFDSRLIVPYIQEGCEQTEAFEFNIPIRALPTRAGIAIVAAKMVSDQTASMEWEEKRTFTLESRMDSKLTFISFDGKKQEFTAAQLETEAEKVLPKPLIVEGSYLKISQVAALGDDKCKWQVETVPPIGL